MGRGTVRSDGGMWRVDVSGSRDSSIRVWDVESGREVAKLAGHTLSVLSAVMSAAGRRLVSGSEDKSIRGWDVERGRSVAKLEDHTGGVSSLGMSA